MIVKRFALFVVNLLFYVGSDSRHTEEAQCALQTEKRFFLAKSGLRVCVCVCVYVCVCVCLRVPVRVSAPPLIPLGSFGGRR